MRRYHVETVCTTDDPIDSLEYHIKTRESGFEIKMLPTWRPDKAMAVEVPGDFRAYVEKLAEVSGVTISTFDDMIAALRKRHDFFAAQGCKLSDHGIEEFYAEDYTDAEIKAIFNKVYGGTALTKEKNPEVQVGYAGCLWRDGLGKGLDTAIPLRGYPQQQQQDVQTARPGHWFRLYRRVYNRQGDG